MRLFQLVQSKFGGERDTVRQVAAKPIIVYSHCTSPLSLMRIPCTCIIHGSRHRYSMCTHIPGAEGASSASAYIIIAPKFQPYRSLAHPGLLAYKLTCISSGHH